MRDINGKSVALLGRRPPHFSTGVYRYETVTTTAGQEYTFSGYIANLTYTPPTIQLNTSDPGAPVYGQYAVTGTQAWEQFSFTWIATVSGPVTLALYDLTTASGGNDFAVDDLDLSAVPEPASAALLGFAATLLFAIRRYTAK